ncbi:MAG: tRNA (adenine-N1)-methyltransferase [Bacillota bacterium]
MTRVFRENDLVIFIDHQGRTYLQRLKLTGRLSTHRGFINHADVIGLAPGTVLYTTQGKQFSVFTPSLVDFTMSMERKSGIIYPKDTAYILFYTNVFPGARVVLGGIGSGALLLAVARQVGQEGHVTGYDVRQDMLNHARKNLQAFLGETPQITLKLGSVYQGIEERDLDAAILDVPEPWEAVPAVTDAVRPGGYVLAYTPSINQAEKFNTALRASRAFTLTETVEVLVRDWYIWNKAVRPNHRMVGHTGFLTLGRRVVGLPPYKESEAGEEDLQEQSE